MSYSPYSLQGQVALITGASSGIGEAAARCLAQAGASVVVNYYSGQEEAEKIVRVNSGQITINDGSTFLVTDSHNLIN